MYSYLLKFFPPSIVNIICIVVYVLLIILIYFFSDVYNYGFKYLEY